MAQFIKFDDFMFQLGCGVHRLGKDQLKVMLTDRAPSAMAHRVKTDLSEIKAGNGYNAGGMECPAKKWAKTGAVSKLSSDPVVFRANDDGEIGPFRYAVLYNASSADKNLMGYWDYEQECTVKKSDFFVVDIDALKGILKVA